MALSLEELKQQREQIQKHLDWLDAKIAECRSAQEGTEIGMLPPSGGGESELKIGTEPTKESDSEETTEKSPELESAAAPEIEAPTYKAKTQGEIRRAKIGCFVFFIVGTALFLFLLFGLPYLL